MICVTSRGTSEFSHGKSTAPCLFVSTQRHNWAKKNISRYTFVRMFFTIELYVPSPFSLTDRQWGIITAASGRGGNGMVTLSTLVTSVTAWRHVEQKHTHPGYSHEVYLESTSSLSKISNSSSEISKLIKAYVRKKWWNVVTHPCIEINGSLVKPQLKVEHEWD